MSQGNRSTFEARFQLLSMARQSYIDRAEQCSALTDPYLFPKEGMEGQKITTPYQSVGAEGVTSLSSRILNILLPPNRPPFRLRIERQTVPPEEKAQWQQIEAGLSRVEKEVTAHIESLGDRVTLAEAIPHLLVTGNVLLHITPVGIKLYNLRSYVCCRNARGEAVEIIIKEMLDPRFLPEEVNKVLPEGERSDTTKPHDRASYVPLFTQIKRTDKGWTVKQECKGHLVGTIGYHKLDRCPWLPLRMYRITGEDYGRSYTEKYLGDHKSLESLTKAIVEGSAAMAKLLILIKPNSTTKAKDIEEAPNLAIISGDSADISTLQMEKTHDFQIAKALIDNLQQRLSRAYLLNSAIQRNAERVTAEEIRYMAQELESALGGLYSVLASEFQRPYVLLRMNYMIKEKLIPDFGDEVEPEIITGIDALGRGQDANRLTEWATALFKTLPADQVMPYLNVQSYMRALASAIGIDDLSLMKSDEEVQQQREQTQQQQLMQSIAPNAVNQLGSLAGKAMEQGQQTPLQP
jgi:hypothetical protein